MPIDEQLDNLEDLPNKPDQSSKITIPDSLDADARKVMGGYLLDFYNGKLSGQDHPLHQISNYSQNILRSLGLELLTFLPELIPFSSRKLIISRFNADLADDKLKEIGNIILGDYVESTDLVTYFKKDRFFNQLRDLIPEFKLLKNDLVISGNNERASQLMTCHPQLIVMSMNLQYRSLATLVVDEFLKSVQIDQITSKRSDLIAGSANLKYIFEKLTPFAGNYLTVAKQYSVKEIVRTMEDFNKTRDNYVKIWCP